MEMKRKGAIDKCPLCRASSEDLRTLQSMLDELYTLCIRADKAAGFTDNLSNAGFLNIVVEEACNAHDRGLDAEETMEEAIDFFKHVDVDELNKQILSLAEDAHGLEQNWCTKRELGSALRRCGLLEESKILLDTVICQSNLHLSVQETAEAHCQLGSTLVELGDEDGALFHLRAAARQDPKWWLPRAELAASLVERTTERIRNCGNKSRSKGQHRWASELAQDENTRLMWVLCIACDEQEYKESMEELEEAEQNLIEAIALNPERDEDSVVNLSRVQLLLRSKAELDLHSIRRRALNAPPAEEQSPKPESLLDPAKDDEEAFRVALAESYDAVFEESLSKFQHADPPAEVDEREAAQVSSRRIASWVLCGDVPEMAMELEDPLVTLTFSRHPEKLVHALVTSPPALEACARGASLQPPWANGARVFADGVMPTDVEPDWGPYTVVIRESDESALWEHLHRKKLPYNVRKLKPGGRVCSPGCFDQFNVSEIAPAPAPAPTPVPASSSGPYDSIDVIVTIKNTFIHARPAAEHTPRASSW